MKSDDLTEARKGLERRGGSVAYETLERLGAVERQLGTHDDDLDTLRDLRELDEKVEASWKGARFRLDWRPIPERLDRDIIDTALKVGRLKSAEIGEALGLHRSTVWRRVRALLAHAQEHLVAARNIGTPINLVEEVRKKGGQELVDDLERPDPPTPEALHRAADQARAHIKQARGQARHALEQMALRLEQAAERATRATFPEGIDREKLGVLKRAHQEADAVTFWQDVCSPEAELLRRELWGEYDAAPCRQRCLDCGRYLPHARTGRPRKWCEGARGERCRKRWTRRQGA